MSQAEGADARIRMLLERVLPTLWDANSAVDVRMGLDELARLLGRALEQPEKARGEASLLARGSHNPCCYHVHSHVCLAGQGCTMLASSQPVRQLRKLRGYEELLEVLGFVPVRPGHCGNADDDHASSGEAFSLALLNGGVHDLALLSALGSCLARAAAPLDFAEATG